MTRALPAGAISIFITLGLILTMYGLIKMDEPELEAKKSIKLPDFSAPPENDDLQVIAPKPERPDKVEQQPDTPEVEVIPDRVNINSNLALGAVRIGINRDLKGFNQNDGEYLPIFRAPPVYPRRAQERGLCGHVDLMYTVTSAGGTKDAVVTASTSSIFERAALKAASKYKYKPRQVGGKPVDVPGVEIRITFQMEEGC